MALTTKIGKYRKKPGTWNCNQAGIDPAYRFMWQEPVIQLPMLDLNPGLTGSGSGQTDNRLVTWDFAGRQLWGLEGSTVLTDVDEIGSFVKFTSNAGTNNLSTPNNGNHYDIPANTQYTFAFVLKIDGAGTDDEFQLVRSGGGGNFIIFDDRKSTGFRNIGIRQNGVDVVSLASAVPVVADEWITLVVCWDGTTTNAYVDSALVATGTSAATELYDALELVGGRFNGESFEGGLAGYYVYKRAWSAEGAARFHADPWGGFRRFDGDAGIIGASGGGAPALSTQPVVIAVSM